MALETLKEYILSDKSEEQKRHLLYQYFGELYKKEFHVEHNKADIYIDGQLVVEAKSKAVDFLSGFYQALHYRKKGLTFTAICVIAHKFIALWKYDDIPKYAYELAHRSDPLKAASEMGRINAQKTGKNRMEEIRKSASFILMPGDFEASFFQPTIIELYEFQKMILNLEAKRTQIDSRNFIETIELLKKFFDKPLDAIHCFYAMVGVWDETSMVAMNDNNEIRAFSTKKGRFSEPLSLHPKHFPEFKKFVERHYIFTNEGSGLTEDYYFSRFDEVISRINPEYARQHGIFFTDINLSKFALWFVHHYFEKKLSERYVVLDPAGGSGNLVTSWKGHLKHKIVSELQPDLLKTIERRMQLDPEELQAGFTIIPKTSEGVGLNFLNISGEEYIQRLEKELNLKNLTLDKPIAFLLNPPYKNTDENINEREKAEAQYDIHKTILELTGEDAGRERYLAFLAQILNICKAQVSQHPEFKPVVMIFTPTSWLIPRPTYVPFRELWDKHFKFENGFIVTGKEFFKLPGKWPLSFSIWTYNHDDKCNRNEVREKDFCFIRKDQLRINWNDTYENIDKFLLAIIKSATSIKLDNSRGDIRQYLPKIKDENDRWVLQPRFNIYRNRLQTEENVPIISGFPYKDDRHFRIKAPHGFVDGGLIGFMDDNTPVRLHQEKYFRLSNMPDRVWFRLDNDLKSANKVRILTGSPDKYGYCAYDLNSAKITMCWYAIAKSLILKDYPLWANQYDIWPPKLSPDLEKYYYSLCFAFALAENVCVVTKFEADNPVKGAPEVFVDNPLCPTNPQSFWSTTLDKEIVSEPPAAKMLVDKIKELYNCWNQAYCKGKTMEYTGLHDEPYFKYFSYPDFLTPYSGLIQIRKYAVINSKADLVIRFEEISKLSKAVKEEIYRLLVKEFGYFE